MNAQTYKYIPTEKDLEIISNVKDTLLDYTKVLKNEVKKSISEDKATSEMLDGRIRMLGYVMSPLRACKTIEGDSEAVTQYYSQS